MCKGCLVVPCARALIYYSIRYFPSAIRIWVDGLVRIAGALMVSDFMDLVLTKDDLNCAFITGDIHYHPLLLDLFMAFMSSLDTLTMT